MERHEITGGGLLMQSVTVYTTRWCPFCIRAKMLLSNRGIDFSEIKVDGDPELRADMARRAGRTSVPQIWIGETHVGGFDDLFLLERQGQLDNLLSEQR